MANINSNSEQSILKINAFLGLNENPDGETTLKDGELSKMRNFKITKDKHLQIRQGTKSVCDIHAVWVANGGSSHYGTNAPITCGSWRGYINGEEYILVAYGGGIFNLNLFSTTATATEVGLCTQDETTFFGFGNKVYMLNGHEYKSWDGASGHSFEVVVGYVPLVQTATTPAGNGTLLENVNRLNGKRRVQFSPDGTATVFYLPEDAITSVDSVLINGAAGETATSATTTISGGSVTIADADKFMTRIRALGGGSAGNYILTYSTGNKWSITISGRTYSGYTNLSSIFGLTVSGTPADGDTITVVVGANYTVDLTNGTVTFTTAPAMGTNTIEIAYTKGTGSRTDVEGMRFSEMYNGSTDTRVFLYGNGTNKTIYSGVDSTLAKASAEYFPDLYEITVGDENTPVTGLIRHYNRMMAFKPNSAWSIQYGTITLDTSAITSAFYCTPVNRQFGNEAAGQVKLLENNPITFDANSIYQWKSSSTTGNITSNETNAKRISDRVKQTITDFNPANLKTFNLKGEHEYWFVHDNMALILNYGNDTWYIYENIPCAQIIEIDGLVYGVSSNGIVAYYSRNYRCDDNYDFTASVNGTLWEASEFGGEDGNFRFHYDGDDWYNEGEEVDFDEIGVTITGVPILGSVLNIVRDTVEGVITYSNNSKVAIDAYASTGSMDFNKDWLYKYSPMIFVAMKPETNARVFVSAESNKTSDISNKLVSYSLSSFLNADFKHFSFITSRKPQVKRVKMKVKKATYYKLVYKTQPDDFPITADTSCTATILETDVRLRYAGYVK